MLSHGQAAKPPVAPAPPPAGGHNDDPARAEGLMILNAMREQGVIAALPIAPDGDAA